jgi:glycosyltransferase involved in cell wall biosynthesis
VQNKVLEAMAMARPIVATGNAVQGIPEASSAGVVVASEPGGLIQAVCSALAGKSVELGAREYVRQHYSWSVHLSMVLSLFDQSTSPGESVTAARTALA